MSKKGAVNSRPVAAGIQNWSSAWQRIGKVDAEDGNCVAGHDGLADVFEHAAGDDEGASIARRAGCRTSRRPSR